jgi:VanZ family protein
MMAPRLFRLAFVAAILVLSIALLAPSHRLPSEVELLSDKAWHVLAFALFALIARLALVRASFLALFLGLVAFSGAMEVLQATMNLGRRGEWIDLVANAIGVAIGLAAGRALYAVLRA